MQNNGRWAREATLADQSRSGRWRGGRPSGGGEPRDERADGAEFGAVVIGQGYGDRRGLRPLAARGHELERLVGAQEVGEADGGRF
jgi:hypothetical protein